MGDARSGASSLEVARYRDGLKVATTIFEAAAWHYTVRAICRCEHFGLFDPHGLWWYFNRKGWDDDLQRARRRLFCSRCCHRTGRRVRPVDLTLTRDPPVINLPLPTQSEWRRALSRFRG